MMEMVIQKEIKIAIRADRCFSVLGFDAPLAETGWSRDIRGFSDPFCSFEHLNHMVRMSLGWVGDPVALRHSSCC